MKEPHRKGVANHSNPSTPGTRHWPLSDHLGSVRDVIDSGTVELHRIYDAFGKVTSETGTLDHLFAYTGRPFDEDTGLQNNLHRWYDASVGRWLSADPIGLPGDANLYRYVGNCPTLEIDPFGLAASALGWLAKLANTMRYGQMQPNVRNVLLGPYIAAIQSAARQEIAQLTQANYPPDPDPGVLHGKKPGQYGFWDIANTGTGGAGWEGAHSSPQSLGELLQHAEYFRQKAAGRGECDCIEELAIEGHATPWRLTFARYLDAKKKLVPKFDEGMFLGTDVLKSINIGWLNGIEVGAALSVLQFCCPCFIYLGGCNAGGLAAEETPYSWQQQIADQTGCTVIGPGGYSYGSYLTGKKHTYRYNHENGKQVEKPSGPETVGGIPVVRTGSRDATHRIFYPSEFRSCDGGKTRPDPRQPGAPGHDIIEHWAKYYQPRPIATPTPDPGPIDSALNWLVSGVDELISRSIGGFR
ncbi:MAG TPA: RHS repeat-associated core domain-containing protein [Thermoguttaceae bacterium]|nr:RHS repeat-associated core domain-containing protein [Thermoguttaceae bacterium]